MRRNIDELTSLFKRLGAREPESWAASEVEENIPQLARFLFLRQAWRRIVSEEDANWPSTLAQIESVNSNAPYAGVGHALASLLEKGATQEELIDLVRGVQAQLLFDICYLLDDPMLEEPDVEDVWWGLFELDEHGQPLRQVGGLHESVLDTDPTGREMRPRPTGG